jgi:hypothetical protein
MKEFPEPPESPEEPPDISVHGFLPLLIQHQRTLPQWEYKWVTLPGEESLNIYGSAGWQVLLWVPAKGLLLTREILPIEEEPDEQSGHDGDPDATD